MVLKYESQYYESATKFKDELSKLTTADPVHLIYEIDSSKIKNDEFAFITNDFKNIKKVLLTTQSDSNVVIPGAPVQPDCRWTVSIIFDNHIELDQQTSDEMRSQISLHNWSFPITKDNTFFFHTNQEELKKWICSRIEISDEDREIEREVWIKWFHKFVSGLYSL